MSGADKMKLDGLVFDTLSAFGAVVYAKDNGVISDGATVNTTTFAAAIAAAVTRGGGWVVLPPGVCMVGNSGDSIAVHLPDYVRLIGAGEGATTLRLANGANAHLINMDGVSFCGVSHMTLDGNRDNQTNGVHTLRATGGGLSHASFHHLEIKNAFHYGIGLQGGVISDVHISDCYIHDTGGDGIDVKNTANGNSGIFIHDVLVEAWGRNASLTVQAAIDLRGPCQVSTVYVKGAVAADANGIRFRQGETTDANGSGAHRSNLTNFDIRLGAAATAGVSLAVVARDVSATNGWISATHTGVLVQDSGFQADNIRANGASAKGFHLAASGSGLDADEAVLKGCKAEGCAIGAQVDANNCQLIGCNVDSNTTGLAIAAGVTDTAMIGGTLLGNTTALSDAGTSTHMQQVTGCKTEANLLSANLTLDTTGTKTAVFTHGLGVTPALEDCILTIVRVTAVTDHVIGYLQVEAVSSTTVSTRARVTTASATAGAVFKIALRVKAKP